MPPVLADEHEADLPQHGEVLGHLRLAEAESFDELVHRDLPGADGIEEVATARLGDGVERIRRRRGASHVDIIFRYRNMSSQTCETALDECERVGCPADLMAWEQRPERRVPVGIVSIEVGGVVWPDVHVGRIVAGISG